MCRKKRILAIIIVLTCAWTVCQAQQTHTVAFSYDLDGNRIRRGLLFRNMEENEENKKNNEEFHTSSTAYFDKAEVSLFPNPTNDKFFIEFKGNASKKAEATLTHITGVVLEKRVLTSSLESFNLSGLAPGVYLLKLTVDNETQVWKVIKK